MEDEFYFGLSKMNKPIRFAGLSSLQLGGSILLSVTIFLVMATSKMALFGLFVLITIWIVLIKFIFKKLIKEHKKGTPDYINSYFALRGTPKAIVDRNFIFSFLIKRE